MKKLTFNSLYLLSRLERRANQFKFHPKATVIRGHNDTGKSSLLKSLYGAFGAEAAKQSPRWKKAKAISLLEFSIDSSSFYILRTGFNYTIFDASSTPIGQYRRVAAELAPALAELLGIGLKLPNRNGVMETPPPAFFFIPFYVDQDAGWTNALASFSNLTHYPNWKGNVIQYHVGLRTNTWYALQSRKALLEKESEEPQRRKEVLISVRHRISKEIAEIPFDLDVEAFKKEVDLLLLHCKDLATRQEQYRHKILELGNEKLKLEAQIEIVERAEEELADDYEFATEKLEDNVQCPTCGANYENNFAERFSIACDEDRCVTLGQELKEELETILSNLAKHRASLALTDSEIKSIESALNHKLGDLTLDELLKRESRKQLASSIDEELKDIQSQLTSHSLEIEKLRKEMSRSLSKEDKAAIEMTFSGYMTKALRTLDVHGIDPSEKSLILGKIKQIGSDLPRAILSYYYSLISTIQKHGTGALCPFVIDSPNQQEQDPNNLEKILNFINESRPHQPQLLLGLVEDLKLDFGGDVIELGNKYSLLSEDEYEEVSSIIRPFEIAAEGFGNWFEF